MNNRNIFESFVVAFLSIVKTLTTMFGRVAKFITTAFAFLSSTFGKVAAISMTIALLLCSYGVVTIIIDGSLEFVVNPGSGNGEEESKKAGSNLSEYEKAILMAEALDLDLMNEDFNNSESMQNFLKINTESLQPFARGTGSKLTPAKLVEIILLIDEIYKHPSVNSDEYTSNCIMEYLYGSWVSEHGMVCGTGDRLYDMDNALPSSLNINGPYYAPLGQRYEQWVYTNRNGMDHLGCTFISSKENPDIPNEQRGIMGGANAIFDAGTAMYLTGGTSFLRRENTNFVQPSDQSYQHLATYTLSPGWPVTRRGFQTWLPDPFYNFAVINRIFLEGYDRDTQYRAGTYGPDNMVAIKEVCELSGFTKEETSIYHNVIYANDRFCRMEVEMLPNNVKAQGKPEWYGCLAAFELILVGEGYHEKLTTELIDNPKLILSGNYDVGDPMLGDCSSSMPYSFVYKEDSYLGEILEKIESGTLTKSYPDYIINRVHYIRDYASNWGSICNVPNNQGTVRILYGFGNYAKGRFCMYHLQNVVKAYYNYQDENGEYRYRLYEVDFGDESGSSYSTTAGSGPFGLPYYNDDGSCNEMALIAATNIFGEVVTGPNCYKKEINIPDEYTVTYGGETVTFSLNGGAYPNFWGTQYNSNASGNWGQCSWWSKGRAMLWLYENISKEQKVWGVHSSTGACWAGNYPVRGHGYLVVGNLVTASGLSSDTTIQPNSITSTDQAHNHTWWVEAIDTVNNVHYESHGNMRDRYTNGFYPRNYSGKSVTKVGVPHTSYNPSCGDRSGSGYCYILQNSNTNHWNLSGRVTYFSFSDHAEEIKQKAGIT